MKSNDLPPDLESALRKFEQYRSRGKVRQFPDELWELAASLVKTYGAFEVASVLKLNATALRRRQSPSPSAKPTGEKITELVEIQPVSINQPSVSKPRCNRVVAELSMPSGFTLKVFSEATADQLKALVSLTEGDQ